MKTDESRMFKLGTITRNTNSYMHTKQVYKKGQQPYTAC